jgi:hypothetical protein
MKLHWRTHNRLVALKYRLLAPFHYVRRVYREWRCRREGHVWFPDCGALYCTRCHVWGDPVLELLGDEMREAKAHMADTVESLFGTIVDDEPGALDEECPMCLKMAFLSDAPQSGVTFEEPVCEECREQAIKELSMDSFDREYERQRGRGWED